MCCAASFSIVSASSWSLIEGREIFLTITECPLTAVATALVLIWLSRNSFEIALDTVPESTIMESTTISDDSGSSPRCATSICPPFFFSSTALMLEEPTSRPTIDFDPSPNMCPPLCWRGRLARAVSLNLPRRFGRRLGLPFHLRFHLARLLFHPLIQPRFLEAPAIAQLECGDFLLADVLVQSVRTHAQVLRRLANVHHFSRVGHSSFALPASVSSRPILGPTAPLGDFPSPCLSAQRAFVSRAYIIPAKPRLRANLLVFPRFSPVF